MYVPVGVYVNMNTGVLRKQRQKNHQIIRARIIDGFELPAMDGWASSSSPLQDQCNNSLGQ